MIHCPVSSAQLTASKESRVPQYAALFQYHNAISTSQSFYQHNTKKLKGRQGTLHRKDLQSSNQLR